MCNLHKSMLVTKSNNCSFLSTSITMYIVYHTSSPLSIVKMHKNAVGLLCSLHKYVQLAQNSERIYGSICAYCTERVFDCVCAYCTKMGVNGCSILCNLYSFSRLTPLCKLHNGAPFNREKFVQSAYLYGSVRRCISFSLRKCVTWTWEVTISSQVKLTGSRMWCVSRQR